MNLYDNKNVLTVTVLRFLKTISVSIWHRFPPIYSSWLQWACMQLWFFSRFFFGYVTSRIGYDNFLLFITKKILANPWGGGRHIKNFYYHFFFKAFVRHRVTEKETSQEVKTSVKKESSQEVEMLTVKKEKLSQEREKPLKQKEKPLMERTTRSKRKRENDFIIDEPSTSTAQTSACVDKRHSKRPEIISVSDSQTTEGSDSECSSPWTNSKDVAKLRKKHKCPHCDATFYQRHHLIHHIMTTCLGNPDSKTNKDAAGKFKCDCGRSYKYAKSLRYHQKHECNKTIQCPDCGKVMQGTFITERHKQRYCVNKRRKIENIKKEDSPDELFIDDSSIGSSD